MTKKDIKYILVIVFAVLVVASLLLLNQYSFYGDDIAFHKSIIDQFKVEFRNGNFFPDILGSGASGLGYGTPLFYPVYGQWIVALCGYLFGWDTFTSIDIGCTICILFSGLSMYYCLVKVYHRRDVALIGALCYVSSNYLITDIFKRCAFSEMLTFIFIPLIILGTFQLLTAYNTVYWSLVVGLVGGMYSHYLSTFFVCVFLVIACLLNVKQLCTRKKVIALIKSGSLILLLTAPIFVSLLYLKTTGDYNVFSGNNLTSLSLLESNTLSLSQVFLSQFGTINQFNIPLLATLGIGLTVYKLIKNGNKYIYIYITFLIVLLLVIMFICGVVPYKYLPSIVLMLQFPWRMCGLLTTLGIMLSCYVFIVYNINFRITLLIEILMIMFCILTPFRINSSNEAHITDHVGLKDEQRWGLGTGFEYGPSTALNLDPFNGGLLRRNNVGITINNETSTHLTSNHGTNFAFCIVDHTSGMVELPLLFYPGYETQKNGVSIKNVESDNGLITFYQDDVNGCYNIKYIGIPLIKYAKLISLITFCSIIIYKIIYMYNKLSRNNKSMK